MFFKRILTLSVFVLFLKFLFAPSAHAYLDPGSGSFIIQMVVAGLMGFILMVKIYWGRIRTFFTNIFSRGENEDS